MSSIGFDDQAPSLPDGGGATASLGSTFTPDLSTGTGSFNVPFDAPNGPNDIGPKLGLRYDTAAGNGPFGLGFTLPIPRIVLDISTGYPRYDGSDPLLLEGAGRLLVANDGSLRPEVDGGAWRAEKLGDGFRLTDRDGLYYDLGTQPGARIADPADASRVYAWQLETITDPLGNAVQLTWLAAGAQRYLQSVSYGQYQLAFSYAPRPDVTRTGRPGFTLKTGLRCAQIELQLIGAAQPVLRRWTFTYTQDPANAVTLLESVILTGVDAGGQELAAPPLRFGYAQFGEPDLLQLTGTDEGALPSLARQAVTRVELVDWNGDGLPDVVEFGADGGASVWTNAGEDSFTGPARAGTAPLVASAQAAVAFADMNGDGFADLIRLDRPLSAFVPREPPDGFGQPVSWTRAPASIPGAPNVRLLDLTGDGTVDLMSSSPGGLALFYRDPTDGWSLQPELVPPGAGPDVYLEDPHVFVADVTGDGSSDMVRIDGGGVTFWPYLGNGRWDAPVRMASPPELPFDVRMDRLILTDVDGDGCADVVYLDGNALTYWINQSGIAFGAPHTIDYVPTPAISEPRLADMTGSGTAGLVWSQLGPFGRDTRYFYLEFVGATKPRLLTTIDNGIGLQTTISYTTSAREAARAASLGSPWATTLPVALSIVTGVGTTDSGTGRTVETTFAYRDGRYDGVLREFAGFGRVDQREVGDADIPTLLTTSYFHMGVDPSAPSGPLDEATRRRLRAIRGRLYRRERFGEDGTPQASLPYDRLEHTWEVTTEQAAAGAIQIPRLLSTVQTQLERQPAAAAIVTTTNAAWDANGNITDSSQTIDIPGAPSKTQVLRTLSTFATDASGRFLSHIYRTQQSDGAATIVADQITEYDGAPEGTVGAQGLVTRRSALAVPDATVATAYGAATPDFAALRYYRRGDSAGWWITQGEYARVDDAGGLRGTVTGPNGASFTVTYDATRSYPAAMVDPAGNAISATYDYRAARVASLLDAAGQEFEASFDALSRLVSRVEPGDTTALPTLSYEYDGTSLPVSFTRRARATSAAAATVDQRALYDGSDTLVQRRAVDELGEIAVETHVYNSRGLLVAEYAAWRPPSPAFAVPPASIAHATLTYDALGRVLSRTNPDGAVRRWSYGPVAVIETDERGKATTKASDGSGRITEIDQQLGARTLTSTNTFDVKGNLIAHTDAAGNIVRTWFDALGRIVRVQRPESDVATVYDAAGNPVEVRSAAGTLVKRTFDGCNRLVTVRTPAGPVASFVYQDADAPPPADAGLHTAGGRCVRIDDESGSTVFDYDERGRAVLKRSTPAANGQSYELGMAYRPDGQLDSITYPKGAGAQVELKYEYNRRGLLMGIPGVVADIGYDLDGRRESVAYANGARSTYGYDPVGRFAAIEHAHAGGAFYSTALTWDGAGNLVGLASPDTDLASVFAYDDLSRLTQASTGAGTVLTYAYDGAGNLTQKSDVGAYAYGEGGAPASCLTTAGADKFTYTALGQMEQTPWGAQSFDALGRLASIAGTTAAQFTYDYAGLRASASFTKGGLTTTRLTPDPLYAIENGSLVLYLFDGVRAVARDVDGGGRTFLHEDHLGSIVRVTDAAAAVVDAIRYDSFGAVASRTPAGGATPIGFAGGELDGALGLLYLQARYYHPVYGRFISPDPIVQDIFDPIAWNAYAYCRNNPQSYVDPSGRDWWQILVGVLAVIAIVALVVVSVLTFGATTPLLVVGIGLVAGGVVGGIAAAQAGGNAGDILLGVLVGAAVGGWASFAAIYAGGAVATALGIKGTLLGAVTAGAVNGAINGAAVGFAAGFAGGHTTLDQILEKVALGALVGAVVGGALGGISYTWSTSPSPSQSPWAQAQKALQTPQPPVGGTGGLPPSVAPPLPTAAPIGNVGQAFGQAGQGLAMKALSPFAEAAARYALTSPFTAAITTLLVDGTAGVTDLGYAMPILYKIGVVKYGGQW